MNHEPMSARPARLAVIGTLMMLVNAPTVGAETLRGIVIGKEGKPVGGATVWAAELYAPGPLAARETQTDDVGRFALAVKPGRWFVWARHDGWAGETDWRAVPAVAAGRDAGPVTIHLVERGFLRVRLIEAETGRPIAGGRFVIDNAVDLKANKLGRCELAGIAPRFHEAYVVAPGRERRRILFDMTLRVAAELELRIPRGGRIFGHVTDEQGHPIPGAFVGYSTSGNTFSGSANWDRCDPDGRYVWDGKVFDRPTRLAAGAPGYQGEERDDLILGAGSESLEVNFRLRRHPDRQAQQPGEPSPKAEPGRDVTGTVTLSGGRPAANAIVRWVWANDSENRETRTDAEGHFRLEGMPDGDGFLAVISPEGAGAAPTLPPVARGGNREIAVALGPGETATGRVLDDAGNPIEGVSVVPFLPYPDPRFGLQIWLAERAARTDSQGRFAIEGLPRTGVHFELHGAGLDWLPHEALKLGGVENVVTMKSGSMIRGRVVDRDGKPVRNFRILVNAPHERQVGEKFASYFAGYCGIGMTFTCDDGVFVITRLGEPGGLCRITAVAEGYSEGAVDRITSTTLGHLPPADAVTIRLGPPNHLRIRAVQAGDEARPVAGARVALINGDPQLDREFAWGYHDVSWSDMTYRRTDERGWADFPGLAFNEATVLVQAPGFGRRRMGWRDGRSELSVALQPEAVMMGDVRDATGAAPRDADVMMVGASGDAMNAPVDAGRQGRFRLTELSGGEYTLTIRTSGAELYQERITLRPGQVLEKSIRLSGKAEAKVMRKRALSR